MKQHILWSQQMLSIGYADVNLSEKNLARDACDRTGGSRAGGSHVYTIAGTGIGPAASTAVRISGSAPGSTIPLTLYNCNSSPCKALPIDLSGSAPVYLSLYGTGIRNRSTVDNVLVTINGVMLPALYAGAQPNFAGLDQLNVQLPAQLSGSGVANVVVKVDQHPANTVTLNIQ